MNIHQITDIFQKAFCIACITFLIVFFIPAVIKAQDETESPPDFPVEVFHEYENDHDTLIPFVFNGYLYTFSLNLETPLWRLFIGGDLISPFVIRDEELFLYDVFNNIYSIDIYRGEIKWKKNIDEEIKGRPLFYEGYIILGTLRGSIFVLDYQDGEILYENRGNLGISASISMFLNLIIVPYKNGKIVAYNVDTREVEWEFNSGNIISVDPVIMGEYLYFGDWDNTLYALDASSGQPLWQSYVGHRVMRDFLVFDDEIILFFSREGILGVERENGNIKWIKYFRNIEFNYNYFQGFNKFFIFTPDFIALSPDGGGVIFNYRERAFNLYKEMLFDKMVEGEKPLSEGERYRILSEAYFSVSDYPLLPASKLGKDLVYFVADDYFLYVYDLSKDFFLLRYKMG